MREFPILFSGAMVRAILDGSKTQTRRVVKDQPSDEWRPVVEHYHPIVIARNGDEEPGPEIFGASDADEGRKCPYGEPGDKLWLRETFAHIYRDNAAPKNRRGDDVAYKADGFGLDRYVYGSWKPSIHMPRWASRISLEITSVRVERLTDIGEGDAIAEGCPDVGNRPGNGSAFWWYRDLWDSLNAARGYEWDANPWVWVVEFNRVMS